MFYVVLEKYIFSYFLHALQSLVWRCLFCTPWFSCIEETCLIWIYINIFMCRIRHVSLYKKICQIPERKVCLLSDGGLWLLQGQKRVRAYFLTLFLTPCRFFYIFFLTKFPVAYKNHNSIDFIKFLFELCL